MGSKTSSSLNEPGFRTEKSESENSYIIIQVHHFQIGLMYVKALYMLANNDAIQNTTSN